VDLRVCPPLSGNVQSNVSKLENNLCSSECMLALQRTCSSMVFLRPYVLGCAYILLITQDPARIWLGLYGANQHASRGQTGFLPQKMFKISSIYERRFFIYECSLSSKFLSQSRIPIVFICRTKEII
jgi:hypothetical protein